MPKTPASTTTSGIFSNLLGGGYFPKELPPTFTTRSFGECAKRYESKNCVLDQPETIWRQYEIHNLARAGTLRRELAIVNPVAYWRLVRLIAKNWTDLKAAAELSPISLTKPGANLPRNLPWGRDIHVARAHTRAKGRFVLNADIANFYGSVYTHTIPWALHTKAAARAALKTGPSLLGDDLDKAFRAMQDGQSVGLPVGPDASLLMAEIILADIDNRILDDHAGKGFRFVDDYELVFSSENDALEKRNKLQSALAEYRLALNPLKTRIERLPTGLDEGWNRDLWRMIKRKTILTKTDVIDFFDRSFQVAKDRPTAGVLKFILGKLCKKKFNDEAYRIAKSLVLQCARVEAGCLPFVLAILLRPGSIEPSWRKTIAEGLNAIIFDHAPQRHSSEVAWALWGCLAIKAPIDEPAAKLVLDMEESVSSLLLYHAYEGGLISTIKEDFKSLKRSLGPDDLSGSRWLLAYEFARSGFSLDATKNNYVTKDQRFGFLIKEKVNFFDISKLSVPVGLIPDEEEEEREDDEEDEAETEDTEEEYSLRGFWHEWDDWGDDEDDDDDGYDEAILKLLESA